MPIFYVETVATSPIREYWKVEAANAEEAAEVYGERGECLYDEVLGEEEGRTVDTVHPEAALASFFARQILTAEAPAMLSALREFLCDQETMQEPYRNEAICERARAILARIDGTPTAQLAAPISEAGAGVRDLLFDVRDFLAGFEDCEDNGELVRGLQERIARATEGRADRPKSEPVADFAAHAAAIEAAQGYVSHPAQWNAPTPAQVAHLLALSGIAHGPVSASDGGDCDGGDD